jgi:hypothetical protein
MMEQTEASRQPDRPLDFDYKRPSCDISPHKHTRASVRAKPRFELREWGSKHNTGYLGVTYYCS